MWQKIKRKQGGGKVRWFQLTYLKDDQKDAESNKTLRKEKNLQQKKAEMADLGGQEGGEGWDTRSMGNWISKILLRDGKLLVDFEWRDNGHYLSFRMSSSLTKPMQVARFNNKTMILIKFMFQINQIFTQ